MHQVKGRELSGFFLTMSLLLLYSLRQQTMFVFIFTRKGLVSLQASSLGLDYLTKSCHPTCMNPVVLVPEGDFRAGYDPENLQVC